MKEIFQFIWNPTETLAKDQAIWQTIWRVLLLIVICIVLKVLSLVGVEVLRMMSLIPQYTRDLDEGTKVIRGNLLYAVVLFPIMEELAFRLYLVRNKVNVFVSAFLMTYMIATNFIFQTSSFSLAEYGLARISLSLIVAGAVLLIYQKSPLTIKFSTLFYCSALIFGLVHIYNHDYTNPSVLLFAPLICLPQIISGLFWGYARIKYGILGGILLHGIMNGIFA